MHSPEMLLASEFGPIPELAELVGWKEIPLIETNKSREPLVPVGIFSEHRALFSSSVYANEHHNSPYTGGLESSNIAVFMREGVADKLEQAARMLPSNHHLMVMDAYRSLAVQASLYQQYKSGVEREHPDWSEEEVSTETQKYVSVPSSDPAKPSPHNTGASVDVVLLTVPNDVQKEISYIDKQLSHDQSDWQAEYFLEMRRSELLRRYGRTLDFGTRFDHGGPTAALRYYEELALDRELTSDEIKARDNRRLLYGVMTTAGMQPYADEWWHYNDPASQMGAKVAGLKYAEYGAVSMDDENSHFEVMRRMHHLNSVRLARGEEWRPPKGLESHYKIARMAILGDNPKNVWAMTDTVDKIQPPLDQTM